MATHHILAFSQIMTSTEYSTEEDHQHSAESRALIFLQPQYSATVKDVLSA